jgi:cytoskeletal protein CcmA (bactofilin family)
MAKIPVSKSDRRRFTDDSVGFASVVGPEVTVEGKVHGAGGLELQGRLEGELSMEGLVWIRPRGALEGNLDVSSVVVEGEVRGDIHCSGKVDLREGCRVTGDITAGTVAAAEGSFFEGRIAMPDAPQPEVVTYTEKRQADSEDEA